MKNMIAGEKGLATSSKACSLERDETDLTMVELGICSLFLIIMDDELR